MKCVFMLSMTTFTKVICVLTCLVIIPASKGEITTMEITHSVLSDDLALTYLIKEPSVRSAKKKAIILLHGVGSNEQDMFSLADRLPGDYYIIAARGKFTLGNGSYAWYNIDFSTGKPVFDQNQEQQSREAILLFLDQVKKKYQPDEIYLGGFSQGSIMSFSIGLLHPDKVKGIICLSGRILQEIRSDVKQTATLQQLNIFLAHGTQDGTLPVSHAREAKVYLEQLHIKLSYHEYHMGHQVSMEELNDLNKWLAAIK